MREATWFRTPGARYATAAIAVMMCYGVSTNVAAQSAPQQTEPPVPQGKLSPYHGVIGGDGKVIPCRCLFRGTAYMLGDKVCMSTPQGTVITECGFQQNNTSWLPTSEPCTVS